MSRAIPIIKGSTGLNTVVDPARLPYDPEKGISDLAVAVNVVVDRTGRISRRDGYARMNDTPAHSLFCDGGDCLFVSGRNLCRLLPDYSHVILRDDLTDGLRMAFCQVNDDIYYSNTVEYGIVREGAAVPWVASPYIGPETNRVFSGPFPFNHAAFHLGRLFVSYANAIHWSEPFAFSWFDMARNTVQFPGRVIMQKPVAAGLFVSTTKATFFIRGNGPTEFSLEQVATYPAIEWSCAIDYVEGMEIGLQEPGLCAVWASPMGACLGTAQGQMLNLNREKVIYPKIGSWGSGLLRGYEFIHTIGV